MKIKKLIEVALPLDKINEASAREKSIRHGHPSTLHLWWARRPLAAARAVLWASLVDAPSSHPELFPTEEEQNKERDRLFKILEDLVVWENSNNQEVLDAAKAEILKYTNGNPPELLDPFAGGGSIPLEGQRLGLKVHAHDLNPVAVMINKAMIEIPPKFAGKPPVNPEAQEDLDSSGWSGAHGLAEDVRYYGEWMKEEAYKRIGHLYPKVQLPAEYGGGEATVIAWIWARTVKCSNPACGCEIPLASSFILSKKKGKEAWVKPVVEGKTIRFEVHQGKCPKGKETNKVGKGASFTCLNCGSITQKKYIHDEFIKHNNGSTLMTIVAEGKKGRLYLSPSEEQSIVAYSTYPEWIPEQEMSTKSSDLVSGRGYGITKWKELFSNRQLTALTTFSSLVKEAQQQAEEDAVAAGMTNDHLGLNDGGIGAKAYGEAIGVYLAFIVDREANYSSTLNAWGGDFIVQTFGRQALPMVWDYAESNPFSNSTGNWSGAIKWVKNAIEKLPRDNNIVEGEASQVDAQSDYGIKNVMISTDPPYYDNIGYADLSDYFYIWMRNSLRNTHPQLFETMLVPKAAELIATAYRHNDNKDEAKTFFENGMMKACKRMYQSAENDIPVTIYYAYKRTDIYKEGVASSGWETMLNAIIQAGFSITGTWPIHTERETGLKAHVNALATSVVLVCRKRSENAPQTTRRRLVAELRRELHPALRKLQQSNIAPVDLAQAAIGPGMAVYSKYWRVLEADGTVMSVRSAQQLINEEVDGYFNEQTGGLDSASRFCVDLYMQYAYNDVKFGEAEVLANAKNISIPALVDDGVLYAKAGNVHLLEREQLPQKLGVGERNVWLLTQQLTYAMQQQGIEGCATMLADWYNSNTEDAKDLAYRLYTIAEQKKWAEEAYAYNALVVAWPDIQTRAAELKTQRPEPMNLFEE